MSEPKKRCEHTYEYSTDGKWQQGIWVTWKVCLRCYKQFDYNPVLKTWK